MRGDLEIQTDRAIDVAKSGNDLLLEARQRLAELKVANSRLREELLEWLKFYTGDLVYIPMTVEASRNRLKELEEEKCEKD